MMGRARFFLMGLALVSLAATSPAMASGEKADKRHVRVYDYGEGRAYCPSRTVIIGNLAVQGGRCYQAAVVRNNRGAFLAFLDPTVRIPVGRLEYLNSDVGYGIRGHIIFLVPLQMTSQLALFPVNTLQLIRLREQDEEDADEGNGQYYNGQYYDGQYYDGGYNNERIPRGHLVVYIPNAPTPNVSVTIVVTF